MATPTNVSILAQNLADSCTITAYGSAPNLPPANMQNPQLRIPWYSQSLGLPSTSVGSNPAWDTSRAFYASLGTVAGYTFNFAALWGTNDVPVSSDVFTAGTLFRMRQYLAIGGPAWGVQSVVRPAITSVAGVVNLAGGAGNLTSVPQCVAPTWMTATVGTSNTAVRIIFSNSATDAGNLPLLAGATLQRVTILVRKSTAGGTNPTVAIDLYEAGVFKANLATGKTVSHTGTGELWTVSFNASLLTSLSTTNAIEILVSGTAGTTSTVEVGGCELLCEHNGYAVDVTTSPMLSAYQLTGTYLPTGGIFLLPSTSTIGGSIGNTPLLFDSSSGRTSFLSVGRLLIGNLFTPAVNMDYGVNLGIKDTSPTQQTPGGQVWGDVRTKLREADFKLSFLSHDEAYYNILDQMDRLNGVLGSMFVMLDPQVITTMNSFYCRMPSLGPVTNDFYNNWTRHVQLEELT